MLPLITTPWTDNSHKHTRTHAHAYFSTKTAQALCGVDVDAYIDAMPSAIIKATNTHGTPDQHTRSALFISSTFSFWPLRRHRGRRLKYICCFSDFWRVRARDAQFFVDDRAKTKAHNVLKKKSYPDEIYVWTDERKELFPNQKSTVEWMVYTGGYKSNQPSVRLWPQKSVSHIVHRAKYTHTPTLTHI